MLKKLRLKFICITMVISTLMLGVIFGLILHFTHESLIRSNISFMEMGGKAPGRPDRPGTPDQSLRFTIVQNPDGTLTVKGDLSDRFDDNDYRSLWNSAQTTDDRHGILPEYALRYFWPPDPNEEVIHFMDVSGELAAMDTLWHTCSIIGICVWLVMLVVSIFLSNWAIHPVEKAWEQQRQFVADASHELKTPLTVIMTNAELLGNPDYSAESKLHSVNSILTMSRRMRHLVESLLELARVDNGMVRTHFDRIDLSDAVNEAILPFEALLFERELTLTAQIQPHIHVLGSKNYLRQVVEILLDNAQKYADAPGQVELSLEVKGKSALLRVETLGVPLTKEQQSKIFERFYRVDQARTYSASYGLGLSIARQIIRDHKGKIWAAATDHSNIFFVLLPTVN